LKKLSDHYSKANTPERPHEAKALERAAFILSSGGTLDDAPQLVVREQLEQKRDREQREETTIKEVTMDWQPPEATPEHTEDQPSRTNIEQDMITESALERPQRPGRLLTKAELWERIETKERELVKRRRKEGPERNPNSGLDFGFD